MIHPSALGDIKREVGKQLKRKIGQWHPESNGVLVAYKGRREVLNGGRGRVVDTSPFVHLNVRYTAVYAKPTVGARLVGTVQAVTSQGDDNVTVVCAIEGELTAVVNEVDLKDRFTLKKETVMNEEDSEEESKMDDDNDSIIDAEETKNAAAFCYLEDKQKGGRKITNGSKVKLQVTEVHVSEGTILSYAKMI